MVANGSIEAIKNTMDIYEDLKKTSTVPIEILNDMNKQLETIRGCVPAFVPSFIPFATEAFYSN